MVDCLFNLIGRFCYLLRFQSYETKCVQLGCFHSESTSLHWNFTWTGSSPISHSWHQKTRDIGLPDGEDCIPQCSWHNTGVWQTDRRTNGIAVAHTALNTLTLWQQKETTRSPVNAEKPCEHNVSWNRVKCCTNVRTAFENACNRQMTFKIIQSHCCCCHLVGHIRFPISLPFKYISILHRFRDINTYLSK